MRVVMLVSAGQFGGLERVAIEGAAALKQAGADVTLVALRELRGREGVRPLTEAVEASGVPFRFIDTVRALDLGVLVRTRAVLQELGPDVVHSHGVKADVFAGFAAPRHSIRVHTVHGPEKRDDLLGRVHQRTLATADVTFTVSRSTQEFLEKTLGIESTVMENGVVTRAVVPRPAKRVVGFAGRLVPGKRVELLIRAAAVMRDAGAPIELRIAGLGPDMERLRTLATLLGLADSVVFEGHVAAMDRFYDRLDVFALPSAAEGRPMVLLEAMAAGRAVVASRVGGVPELLSDGLGTLVDDTGPGAVDAWKHALELALGTQGNDTAARATQTAESRSMRSWAKRTLSAYGTALVRRRRQSPTRRRHAA